MGALCKAIVLMVVVLASMPAGADQPTSKRCVGDPPRQTEDPMSPPCVPWYSGDNGGATAPGVTDDEVRVLLYFDRGSYSNEATPASGIYEVDHPGTPCGKVVSSSDPCDHIMVRVARGLAGYFNDRFMTYGRRVRYFVHFGSGSRRSDALQGYDAVRPFAVLDQAVFSGNHDVYADAMASRGVMVFSTPVPISESVVRAHDPLIWSFWPGVEARAASYASYVCRKVAPYPVSHTGAAWKHGDQRVFGIYRTTDPDSPGLVALAAAIKEKLSACGVAWVEEQTFPDEGFAVNGSDNGIAQLQAASRFRRAGVTTVLWLGGVDTRLTHDAAALGYLPEIVFAGDLSLDGMAVARLQNQAVWRNAWGTHHQVRIDSRASAPGYREYMESTPGGSDDEAAFAALYYRDHFLLFMAIQSAGPTLTPENVAQGLRARPASQSSSPYGAACFFPSADTSCVQDAAEIWWDPTGFAEGSQVPGCYRMGRGGRRYLPEGWPGGDDAFTHRDDPCTAYNGTYRLRVA